MNVDPDGRTAGSVRYSRRGVLRGAAVLAGVGGSAALTACTRAESGEPSASPSFVLVHGSASNAHFWTPLVRELALLGRRSLPVDLPGHGADSTIPRAYQAPQDLKSFASAPSAVSRLTLADYADHVRSTVETSASHGPVVLVAHSLGGSVITTVANAAPELLAGITYVSAFCCTTLASPLEYLGTEEAARGAAPPTAPTLDDELTARVPPGTSRYNWRSSDVEFVTTAHTQLMADVSEEEFLATIAVAQQPDESIQASLDAAQINPATWGSLPRAYVRLTRDRLNTPALQDRMIAEADDAAPDNPFRIVDIDTSHLGIRARAGKLAAHLNELWP